MGKERNTDFKLEDFIYEILSRRDELEDEFDICSGVGISEVITFDDYGMLTSDAGLVIKLYNGEEYQLTIVQRR